MNAAKEPESDEKLPGGLRHLPGPTLGGKQFWTDVFHRSGWRIQRSAILGHHRLLDPNNVRRSWGTLEHCCGFLDKQNEAARPSGTMVILLHGLMRSRNSMRGLGNFLLENEYQIANVEYASTRATLAGHAQALLGILDGMPDVETFHFVGHSLGNLVTRRMLRLLEESENPAHQTLLESRLGKMVMLGAPNNGAEFAQRFKSNPIFRMVWGKSGDQLGMGWDEAEHQLCTPPFPFGVIAGSGPVTNPILDGESDLIVTVNETRLVGADDFLIVPVIHALLMNHSIVHEAALRFLSHGQFRESKAPCPIESVEMTEQEESLARDF